MYLGFGDAFINQTALMDDFVNTFAPEEQDNNSLYLILDAIGLGLSIITPPIFNNIFRRLSVPNTRDETYALIPWVITIAKDVPLPSKDTLGTKGSLLKALSLVAGHWQMFISTVAREIFEGKENLEYLSRAIENGTLIQGKDALSSPMSAEDFKFRAQRVLLATMIPNAWRTRSGTCPVVLTTGKRCDTVGFLDDKMLHGTSSISGACHRGELYYLVKMAGDYTSNPCPCYPGAPCTPKTECGLKERPFEALPGIEYLTPGEEAYHEPKTEDMRGRWGAITRHDLVIGAINTAEVWPENAAATHGAGETKIDEAWTKGTNINIRAPGIVRIPLCSCETAQANWYKYPNGKSKPAKYPCN
ncbi:glycosylhydrolase family 18-6 [Colletotrichum musicola]|uniref:Glycosylhydrolase family 18-6 n=1 Tax=Colletotrichum musicola TaxID=2175873 RepID=A0A8H6K0C5_9PEZI|nr:glycosylhydrolase family 18-6 [Colletotrichum musicola]